MADTWFLPAKDVKLTSAFNTENSDIKVGEAISRTVQVFALGASEEQLPDIQFNTIDGAKIYVDKSEVKSIDTPQGTAAIKEYVISIIPTRSGEVVLPGIELNWWNTVTDKEELATLANKVISVKAVEVSNDSAAANQIPGLTKEIQSLTDSNQIIDRKMKQSRPFIKTGTRDVLIFVVSLCLIALLLLILQQKRQQAIQKTVHTKTGKEKKHMDNPGKLYREVESACLRNNPLQAYIATMKYLNFYPFEHPLTKDVLCELRIIEQSLYSNQQKQNWQGQRLLEAIKKLNRMTKKSSPAEKTGKLHPLYPVLNA